MANKILVARGTKARIETVKSGMLDYELVYSTDTNELAVKKPDGNVKYIGINLDEIGYMNHAAKIFYDSNKRNQFKDAWEHSLTVDPEEISVNSSYDSPRGKAQYPNGETEGVIIPQGVTNIGNYAFRNWQSNNQPLVIPDNVTSIGKYAFQNWQSNDQPLVIPNSLTSIGNSAFEGWQANTHPLIIPNSVTTIEEWSFYGWQSNDQPLVIPNSVTTIEEWSFYGWQSVPYVEMKRTTPPTLAGSTAFAGQNDAPIYVPDESVDDYKTATNWVSLADRIFSISDKADLMDDIADLQENKQDKLVAGENITIEDNVISASGIDLNEMAYFDYAGSIYGDKYSLLVNAWEHSLTVDPAEIERESTASTQYGTLQYPNGETEGVIIPNSVTSIGKGAFYDWSSNNQPLVIPNSVTSIGQSAFFGWTSNNQPLVIPNSVQSIGGGAFYDWSSNNQPLVIPNSITSIAEYAFHNWKSNNQPLVIPNSVTSIGNDAFSDWESNNQPLTIPNSVTSIGIRVFSNWESNNQPLVIPNSVQSIGGGAFQVWKSNNQPLVIPNSITSIAEYAFAGWNSNNQPLVIPDSVTSIGNKAFYDWLLVPYVEIQAITPPTLASSLAFTGQNNAPIYVPDESVDDYKTATNWVSLADRIFPISDKDNTYTKGEIDLMIGDIENALDAILGV